MKRSGKVLQEFRLKLGLSKEEFGKKLGVSEITVRSWENGNRGITAERARDIEERTKGGLTRELLRPDLFGDRVAA